MKKIISILMAVCMILCFTACEAKPTKQETESAEAVKLIQNDLKDPTSMRIYGDILKVDFNIDEEISTAYCLTYDAKNSYGAYSGRTKVEIYICKNGNNFYVTENDKYLPFLDLEKSLAKNTKKLDSTDIKVSTISGSKISKALKIEFVE